ncbi:hypothetical protein pipiens_010355 [Culex pipiens pipiens]|uniref:Core Histone H2A/H2B/H3 domain-containing protein n=1 Tax=Culex pipiens pipiens TaxID=38569 RepID=A0ABD1DB60_CULPP
MFYSCFLIVSKPKSLCQHRPAATPPPPQCLAADLHRKRRAPNGPDLPPKIPEPNRQHPHARLPLLPHHHHHRRHNLTSSPSPSGTQSHRRKAPAPKKSQTAALKEIAKLQRTTNPVIPKLPFARLIREILMEYSHRELRITPESLQCLQESAEVFAVQLMEDAYRCTLHRDRLTLMPKDMKLAVMLRKDSVMV